MTTMDRKADKLLTLTEAAQQFNRSVQTVTRWLDDNLLEYATLPSGRRGIRQSEVDKYLGNPPENSDDGQS